MGNKIKSRLHYYYKYSPLTLLLQLLFTFIHLEFVTGIEMKNVSIPHYAVVDGTTQLFCDFDIGSDKLFDLKWYKDEKEFFRYDPSKPRQMLVYNVDGVNVDLQGSNQKVVTLKNISLQTSGIYRCEVLADTSFQRITDHGQMIVIAPPLYDPEIILMGDNTGGNYSRASVRDRIIGNCTSYRSKPAASLMFYINGQKPDVGDITEFTPINESGGLETSILGFNFLVEPLHFLNPNAKIELKCTASIGNHYRVSIRNIFEAKFTAQPSSERNQLSVSSSSTSSFSNHISKWISSIASAFAPIVLDRYSILRNLILKLR